jgi:DNA adenine methylase
MKAKPFVKWVGGKTSTLDDVRGAFPEKFNRLIEPFVGGGSVFFSFGVSQPAILNDRNTELLNLYKMVKTNPYELMTIVDIFSKGYCEESYYTIRAWSPDEDVYKAARTLFLNKTCFNGLFRKNQSGQFNVPFCKKPTCPVIYNKENILTASLALQHATLLCRDFESAIDMATEGDLVYCDPPYDRVTSSSFTSYTEAGFSREDQTRLRDACVRAKERGAFVFVSNAPTEFIKEIYSGFNMITTRAKRSINSNGKGRGDVDEILVCL